jgi:TolA-binding protein
VLRKVPVDLLYREGLALFGADQMVEARPYFQAVQREAPLSTTAIHSRYFEASTYFREEQWKEAEDVFRRLVQDFPDGLNAPEAQYHVGLCRLRQGDRQGAIDAWNITREEYPGSRWAGHAGERLAELQK